MAFGLGKPHTVAHFILHDEHYQTLQLTGISYQTKQSVRKQKLERNSGIVAPPDFLGFNGKACFL